MRSWISATSSLASVVMIAKCANPPAGGWILPILPQSAEPEGAAVLHGYGKGLLGLLALDRLPLEEAVHRDDAASPPIGVTEARQRAHRLTLGINSCGAPSWWRAAGRGLSCRQKYCVLLRALAIGRCARPCERARAGAGTAAADTARRSYRHSFISRVIATAAATSPRANRTITRTRCAQQGAGSDTRLIPRQFFPKGCEP